MAGHYWDSVDLRDTLWLTDTASLEQSFATWSWMLQHVPAQDASRMVSGFVSGLAEDRGMLYKVRSMAEKMVTLGKREDLHAKRQVFSYITKETVAKKVIDEIAPKYADRTGGYTRIVKTGVRRGDAAEMAIIELV